MTPERYKQVKEIFLTACEKSREERTHFIATACNGDEEMRREVEGLLAEHNRGSKLIPTEPEGPLGPMSSILSRAGIDVASGEIRGTGDGPDSDVTPSRSSDFDDAHDQTTSTRSGIVDAGRFPAGTMIAGRYRIIELLGRGGMGEVYRADDIMLNQSIAMKFLPALFGTDQIWLERFRNEVRLARQVTHPNVCRVFDISEHNGEQFITMEYVDGENLASLLRRIGRVPHDKAILLARQLCAGLSVAHERGVLHRDLKPANVMIDGYGSVRITDFGLAAPIDQLKTDAIRAGTPAYMSPEQLAGKAVTVRSDVYSLGLVLYEMFTGRRAFRGENLREYQRLHATEDPTPPSEIIDDIDPIVDRVIMRCLEKDPKDRPASTMAVSAALPGGNPLREILAAGETPSPEVVAAAGETGAMRPELAIGLLVAAIICMIGFVIAAPRIFVVQRALQTTLRDGEPLEADPAALKKRAQDILLDLGYNDPTSDKTPIADRAWGFELNRAYYLKVENDDHGTDRLWRLARPRMGLVYFWYRQSPALLVSQRAEGAVNERDPAADLPGMINVQLDPLGRLIGLEVQPKTPPQAIPAPEIVTPPVTAPAPSTTASSGTAAAPTTATASATAAAGTQTQTAPATEPEEPIVPPDMVFNATDWSVLLKAAGVDLKNFTSVAPEGTPPVYADERVAWKGNFVSVGLLEEKDRESKIVGEPVRIEGAAYHGRPVYFAIIGSWKDEQHQLSEDRAEVLSVGQWNILFQTIVIILLLAVGTYLAWKNHRSGRGDRVGARRMGFAFFMLGVVAWVFSAHHVPDAVSEFILFRRGMGPVLYAVALMWIFYMAMEPYVRRIWPETVISWSRLLAGKWIDPLVGRDVLAGAAVGVLTTLLSLVEYQIPQWLGENVMPVPLPSITSAALMLRATQNYAGIFESAIVALYFGLILLLCMVLLRMATRSQMLASTLSIMFFAIATAHYRIESPWALGWENLLSLAVQAILAAVILGVLTRHGLVGVIFCLMVRAFLMDFPVTWNFYAWYAGASLAGILPTLAILGVAFYAAVGGKIGHRRALMP